MQSIEKSNKKNNLLYDIIKWIYIYISYIRGFLYLKKHSDCFFVICPYGIGDILIAIQAINLLETDMDKKVIIVRAQHQSMACFCNNAELIADSSISADCERYIVFSQKWIGKNYYYGHFKKDKEFNVLPGELSGVTAWEDYANKVYHVQTNQLRPRNREIKKAKVETLKNNDIIICPYANSNNLIDESFWEELSIELSKHGFNVYCNVAGNGTEKLIRGTAEIKCGLDQLCKISKNIKAVIAYRSGICDLLACETDTKLIVINKNEKLQQYWDVSFFRENNVINMLYDNNHTLIIQKIISEL